jgi:uncharacterized protein YqhQ
MNEKIVNNRLNTVGGQAVIEGVMMKHKNNYAITVRKPDGTIDVKSYKFQSLKKNSKVLKLPLIRGFINFIDMMILSYGTLTKATDMLGIAEIEEKSRFEKWMNKHFGSSFLNFVMGLATVFSLLLAIVMFIILPTAAGSLINSWFELGWARAFVEGLVRIIILILYLYLVSLIPDMKRVFEYHGAEHKSVFCYESGKELTPENAKLFKRFHPRCGTSFLFVLIIISIIISTFIPFTDIWVRTIAKIIVAPVVISLGYELLMYSGNHENKLVKILVAPGLWMQRITTQEPDDTMLEVALVSLQTAMPDIFPDFIPPTNANKDENINTQNNM